MQPWHDLTGQRLPDPPGTLLSEQLTAAQELTAARLESGQATLQDLSRTGWLFTPALLHVLGGLERDLLPDFLTRTRYGHEAQIAQVCLENRSFLDLPTSSQAPFFAETLFWIDPEHWRALKHFYTSVGILHREKGVYYRVRLQMRKVPDYLWMEKHPAADFRQVPQVPLGVFVLYGNRERWTVQAHPTEPWRPLQLQRSAPDAQDVQLGASFLTEYPHGLQDQQPGSWVDFLPAPESVLDPVPALVPEMTIQESYAFLRHAWEEMHGHLEDPETQARIERTLQGM